MFDEEINVVKIMEEIKREVLEEKKMNYIISDSEEIERIDEFITNTRNSSKSFYVLGVHLPTIEKFPNIINKFIHLIAKIIRKSCRFIIRDQMSINDNMDACIQALLDRQDEALRQANEKIGELEHRILELEKSIG